MSKLLKIVRNSLLFIIEYSLIIIIFLAFAIKTPSFQTFLADQAVKYISKSFDAPVTLGKIDISFFDRAYFDELYIPDQRGDTLIYLEEFFVNVSDFDLNKLRFDIDQVAMNGAHVELKKYKDRDHMNYQFLIDMFKSDQPSEDQNFEINLAALEIKNSFFAFDNNHEERIPFGVDYNHLSLSGFELEAHQVTVVPEEYIATIESLAVNDRSGFEVENMLTQARFSNTGLSMRETSIKTNRSQLDIPNFTLGVNDLSDFSEFVSKVNMKSEFSNADVSLYDVSLFVPQLKGMNDRVWLKLKTDNTVNDLLLQGVDLKYKERTRLKGDFKLVDFRNLSDNRLNQFVELIAIDANEIRGFKLPDVSSIDRIEIPESLSSLKFAKIDQLKVKGSIHDFELSIQRLTTNVGEVDIAVPMLIKTDSSFSTVRISPKDRVKNEILVRNLDAGLLTKDSRIGIINGGIDFTNLVYRNNVLDINSVSGLFKDLRIADYTYAYLVLDDVNYSLDNRSWTSENQVDGMLIVRDENLDLTFDGLASIGSSIVMKANLNLECAHLESLSPALKNRGDVFAALSVDAEGQSFKEFKGELDIDTLFYSEDGNDFHTNRFIGSIERSERIDKLKLASDWIEADVLGKIDFSLVGKNILSELEKVFPAFIPGEAKAIADSSYFDYNFYIKDINPILNVVYPSLQIAKDTRIDGRYLGRQGEISMNAESSYIALDSSRVENISIIQDFYNEELLALYRADRIFLNDSLTFQEVHFTSLTANGFMDSQLIFHDTQDNRSNLEWYTHLFDTDGFDIDVLPSYFTINEHKWALEDRAHVNYTDNCFFIEDFKLQFNDQYISADGQLSKYPFDKLYVDVKNVDLNDVGVLLGQDFTLSGRADAVGSIATPFTSLKFTGDVVLQDFYINETEVGLVSFGADYLPKQKKVQMLGDINYKKKRTFNFNGDYLIESEGIRESSRFDLSMNMNGTDISVVNEFLDPEVVSGLEGQLYGKLALTGTAEAPLLTGNVEMKKGKVNLAILGADMFFEGEVESVEDGFYINSMPLSDEDGNTGFITGSLFHDNFENFFFEIIANLEEHPFKRMPNNPAKALPVDRFLVMKTEYKDDEPYYGTAYIKGIANISGYADNLTIDVAATTRKGTNIFFPMYGPTTIEEEGFISFKNPHEDEGKDENEVDLTGVDFNFDFNVTDEAKVKLIFDENIGDEISAYGSGELNMGVDQYGELTLKGTYTVTDGVYNFAMGPYKQNFNIEEGGTIQWTGDPYQALLDINTFYVTKANLAIVMPDVIENRPSENELIKSYLYLDGMMTNPEISFDLEAPNASESGKATIARIRSDQDELNKQFFSILISRSFMPLAGQEDGAGGSGGALLDLASTQINSLLNKVSQNYQMNVNLENDNLLGQFSGEFGLSKNFLNDRLQVSGSVGVGSVREDGSEEAGAPAQNSIISDVEVEYLLNEDGTFRISAFNESNNNAAIQNNNQGQFTQGIGVSYKEDFHTLEDFKLFQFFANLFRGKDNKKDLPRKKDNREPIPAEYLEENAVKEEE